MFIIKFTKCSLLIIFSTLFILWSCDDNPTGSGPGADDSLQDIIVSENFAGNPTGYAPLAARLELTLNQTASVELHISSDNPDAESITQRFSQTGTTFRLPVLGLLANAENSIELRAFDADGGELGRKTYTLETGAISAAMPQVTINQINEGQMAAGMTFVSYFGTSVGGDTNPQKPFIFDKDGHIRWYLDFTGHPQLGNLFYDNGMERLENGNLYFGDGSTNRIYEIDMLGNILNQWEMPGYGFHHNVIEIPNGNFIATVNKFGEPTVEDYIIEIDRSTGEIVTEWNLNQSLDNQRRAWPTNLADLNVDWFHANALAYDANDDAIVVSGRTQGVVKLSRANQVQWIMAPHRDWATSGRGEDLTQFLLQPLDASGEPITNSPILNGFENHPDFEWNWYQHAPLIMPNGHIMLFDNGDNRNYTSTGFDAPGAYSRVVEFDVNQQAMSIAQQWQFGKEQGKTLFSRIVSDADYDPATGHVFMTSGSIAEGDRRFGRVLEIDKSTGSIIYDARITPPAAGFDIITMHRTQRLPLYPK